MSDYAILLSGESEHPTVVRLSAGPSRLGLLGTYGVSDSVAWWRLYRVDEDGSTHRFRRVDRRNWELRVTSGADRELLAHIGPRPLQRLLHPLRRLEALKVVAGILVLFLTIAESAPPEWLAKFVPEWAQERLLDGIIAGDAPIRCSHAGGEAALRKLLVRLDPRLGQKVDIVGLREPSFVVSAAPGGHIFVYHGAMQEIDPSAMPALLAHELSHIRHRDPMTAVLRRNGFLKTWAAIIDAGDQRALPMQFSGLEERRADLEAMRMMRRAGFALKPAADMFEQMRVSKEQGGYFAYDDRDFHFGIEARAQRWAEPARSDPVDPKPVLTNDEESALFNFCWTGPIPPLPKGARSAPQPTQPGTGSLGGSSAVKGA